MTNNELKFFDPETGAGLHRVPEGATIPKNTPHGYIRNGERWWRSRGLIVDWRQEDDIPRFTREPLAPPAPPLPTQPGYYTDKDGDLWHVNDEGDPVLLLLGEDVVGNAYHPWGDDDRQHAPFTPASIVPTETWDRLRVLDPEDKRDRVDADGDLMRFTTQSKAVWGAELAARHLHYGPLRFADEVSDR